MLILYVTLLSSKISVPFTKHLLKGYSNPHKMVNWNLWKDHQVTSFPLQKDVTFCNVNSDCHFTSSFIKHPLFKEQPHERRISGSEPTEISVLLSHVMVLKLSCKTRKYMGITWKICLRGPEEKAFSIQAPCRGFKRLRTICPFSNLWPFTIALECWVPRVPRSLCQQTQQLQSSRVLPHMHAHKSQSSCRTFIPCHCRRANSSCCFS